MIFWLLLKFEIIYRIMIYILKYFGFVQRIFLKIIFLHVEIFEFPYIILLLPSDTFYCKWQGHSVTHPLFSKASLASSVLGAV